MALTAPVSGSVTNEVLLNELAHLRSAVAELKGLLEGMNSRVTVLEHDRTRLWTIVGIGGFLGAGGLAAAIRLIVFR